MMIIMLLVLVIEKLVVLAIVLVVVLDIGSVGVDRVPTLLGNLSSVGEAVSGFL